MREGAAGEPARARNSDIVEDLGLVRYVFSDKTGTLTANEMQLRAVAVRGATFGGGGGVRRAPGPWGAAGPPACASDRMRVQPRRGGQHRRRRGLCQCIDKLPRHCRTPCPLFITSEVLVLSFT